jgi:hypothetical protein
VRLEPQTHLLQRLSQGALLLQLRAADALQRSGDRLRLGVEPRHVALQLRDGLVLHSDGRLERRQLLDVLLGHLSNPVQASNISRCALGSRFISNWQAVWSAALECCASQLFPKME